jgi:hypothetical protein
MKIRLVFGYRALKEKILLDDFQIKDEDLEVVKYIFAIYNKEVHYEPTTEIRFLSIIDDKLVFEIVNYSERIIEKVSIPLDILMSMKDDFLPIMEEFCKDSFVDIARLFRYPNDQKEYS